MDIEWDDAAYAAKLWADGKTQVEIARMIGKNSATPISIAIGDFLRAYSPKFKRDMQQGRYEMRQHYIPDALAKFHDKHGYLPNKFSMEEPYVKLETPPDPRLIRFAKTLTVDERLDLTLAELPLTVRLRNCLITGNGFVTVRDVYAQDERMLLRTPNFGRTSLGELREVLAELGLPQLETDRTIPVRTAVATNGSGAAAVSTPTASALEMLDQLITRCDRIEAILNATLRELQERD